ncbi:MAG: 1-phosphofructokinase family hexose kinase [Capsulimonadaceae bacterium]|nr:1-phosphofructokinase family hexose kinase [Capsulimonadaceae bacterium]
MQSTPTLLTVTLNPAVDRNYCVDGLKGEGVHRAACVRVTAGGKGVNVARVWNALGGRAVATGLAGGTSGDFLCAAIETEGIENRFVRIKDETRWTVAAADPSSGRELVINEQGPAATEAEQAEFLAEFSGLLRASPLVAICGSAAVGVAAEFYRTLVELCAGAGARVLVDLWGENLKAAVAGRPNYVKVNIDEAASLGEPIEAWDDAPVEAMKICRASGIEYLVISGGDRGAIAATASHAWRADAPSVRAVTTLGSGDSMTAGILWGLAERPGDFANALRWGVAAGTANTLRAGAGWLSIGDISAMWGRINSIELV